MITDVPSRNAALSCKKEAISEHDPETLLLSVDQGSYKMDRGKMENCSVLRQTDP